MLNTVHLIGRLGNDPEGFDYTDGRGARLSIATSSYSKGEEKTEWHRVTLFGKSADFALDYLAKGRLVYVEGRIETSKYEKDGEPRYSTQIVAYRCLGLDKPSEAAVKSEGSFDADADEVPF